MPFTSCGGCLKDIFITEAEIIDRYVGNQLWVWGIGTSGQLGNNLATDRSSPIQTVSGGTNWKQVSGFSSTAGGIKTDGSLWMWGNASAGLLGNNAVTLRSSPVQTVSAGTNWKSLSVGFCGSAAIKTDGTLWLWGCDIYGKLGANTNNVHRSSPVQTISAGTNWKQVSIQTNIVAAVKTDGTLWTWGHNVSGAIGDNSVTLRSSPVQTISGGTNWKQVAVGWCHMGAIKCDGTLWMWGDNSSTSSNGLGDGTGTDRSSPVQTVSGGTDWKNVALGASHSAAIKKDGTLWLWGNNSTGAFGRNNRTSAASPVQTVSGGSNWKQVSLGNGHTVAIKTDGTLWTWGTNTTGNLGNNNLINQSSPVQTVSGGTNWKQVSTLDDGTVAVTFAEA